MKRVLKISAYSLIIIVTIYLFISIAGNYAAHLFLAEYKSSLKKGNQDIVLQDQLLKRSLRLSPSNAQPLFELGKLYAVESVIDKESEAGNSFFALSKEIFQKGLESKPTDGRKRAEYAWYIGSNGETLDAIGHFNIAAGTDPTDAYPHLLYAMWCVNQVKNEIDITDTAHFVERYRNGRKKYEALKSYNDLSINGVTIAGFLEISQSAWDKVLSFGRRLRKYEYENLADLKLLKFKIDNAIENYERADNRFMLARCYIVKGDYSKAVDILGRIINRDSAPGKTELKKTEKLFLDVLDNDPENYQSFYWLGKIHTISDEIDKAIGAFKTTVRMNPKQIDAHMNLAELYRQKGEVKSEIGAYEAILRESPRHKKATRLLSDAILQEYREAAHNESP